MSSEVEPEAPFVDETSTDDSAPWDATAFDEDDLEEVELINPVGAISITTILLLP